MEADAVYALLKRKIEGIQTSGGGITDYRDLNGKPRINGVTLQGDLTSDALGLDVPEELRLKVNMLSRAKHTTEEVRFFMIGGQATDQNITVRPNENILDKLGTYRQGNMELSPDGYITLSKGRTYRLHANIHVAPSTNTDSVRYFFITDTGGFLGPRGYRSGGTKWNDIPCVTVHTPIDDIRVGLILNSSSDNITLGVPFSMVLIEEINDPKEIDPVEYVMSEEGIEDTPVGSIISFMGNTPPKHYLACDGAEYDVCDYAELVQHFIDAFGSVNYFGGDGVDTFAVPDMRNEFIRGYHGDAADQLSGDIGRHQEPTTIPHFRTGIDGTTKYIQSNTSSSSVGSLNYDKGLNENNKFMNITGGQSGNHSATRPERITIRPTNVAVLFCIKYEKTPFVQFTRNTFALEKSDLIFDDIIPSPSTSVKLPVAPKDEYDVLHVTLYRYDNDRYMELSSESIYVDKTSDGFNFIIDDTHSSSSNSLVATRIQLRISGTTMSHAGELITPVSVTYRLAIRGIKYTRIDGLNGKAEISQDASNVLIEKPDGLYAPAEVTYTDEEIEEAVMEVFYPEEAIGGHSDGNQ